MRGVRQTASMGCSLVFASLFVLSLTGCAFAWPWSGVDAPSENFVVRPSLEIAANANPAPAAASAPATSRIVRNSLGMEFVLVPPGEFVMGGRGSDAERPLRRVSITLPIYMGRFPVTQAQWQRIMGDNPSWKEGCGNCPVEQVSYRDVEEFLGRLNRMDRGAYRLPTEAEWEYAARAGSDTPYCFGADANRLAQHAWFYRNTRGGAQPVGQKQPNAWGLHGMHGNVWEWVQDWYGPYPASQTAVNPVGPARGKYKVIRGGSWTNDFDLCRSAARMKVAPGNRHLNLGFRVVLVPGGKG